MWLFVLVVYLFDTYSSIRSFIYFPTFIYHLLVYFFAYNYFITHTHTVVIHIFKLLHLH